MDNVTLSDISLNPSPVYSSPCVSGAALPRHLEALSISAVVDLDAIQPTPLPPSLPPRLPRRTTSSETSSDAAVDPCSTPSVPCGLHHHHHQFRPCPPLPPAPPLPAREPLHCAGLIQTSAAAASTASSTTAGSAALSSAGRRIPSSVRPLSSPSPPILSTSAPPLDQIVPLDHWPLSSSHPRSNHRHHQHAGLSSSSIVIADKLPASSSAAWFGGNVVATHHRLSPSSMLQSTGIPVAPVSSSSSAATPIPASTTSELVIVMPTVSSQPHSGNLYVEAPSLRCSSITTVPVRARSTSPMHPNAAVLQMSTTASGGDSVFHSLRQHQHNSRGAPTPVVSTQPQSIVKLSDAENHGASGIEKSKRILPTTSPNCRGSVLCPRCNRCPCEQCRSKRELPRRWIGDCECSAQRCVKVTSCLCCIEAIFYHCLDGGDEVMDDAAVDDPCACCERPRCCLRWTVMTALGATVLPCLCLYCPLQCGIGALTACYNACLTERGCRCQTELSGATTSSSQEASSGGSTRGLLAESENSST